MIKIVCLLFAIECYAIEQNLPKESLENSLSHRSDCILRKADVLDEFYQDLPKVCRHSDSLASLQEKIIFEGPLMVFHENEIIDAKALSLIDEMKKGMMTLPISRIEGKNQGCGGNYRIFDQTGQTLAIFKPSDEEPHGKNNPHMKQFDVWKGIHSGEGAINEEIAYLLDYDHFANVPFTCLVVIKSPILYAPLLPQNTMRQKIGSIQQWEQNTLSFHDFTPEQQNSFADGEIHKIALLDMRLLNYDRNACNILVQGKRLIPIDHGPCLCDDLQERYDWCWMLCPQSRTPWSLEEKQYVAKLDPLAEMQFLRKKRKVRRKALFAIGSSTILLQQAVKANLTAFEIGKMIGAKQEHYEENPIAILSRAVLAKVLKDLHKENLSHPYRDKEIWDSYFALFPIYCEEMIKAYKAGKLFPYTQKT